MFLRDNLLVKDSMNIFCVFIDNKRVKVSYTLTLNWLACQIRYVWLKLEF